jgi:PleD family two-component response regulator
MKLRSLLAVPLRSVGGVLGVIELLNRRDEKPFNDEDLRVVNLVADQMVIAIQHAWGSLQTLDIETLVDEPSHVASLRYIEEALDVARSFDDLDTTTTMPAQILVVDDGVAITDMLTILLMREGYSVTTAHNGLEALEKVSNNPHPWH